VTEWERAAREIGAASGRLAELTAQLRGLVESQQFDAALGHVSTTVGLAETSAQEVVDAAAWRGLQLLVAFFVLLLAYRLISPLLPGSRSGRPAARIGAPGSDIVRRGSQPAPGRRSMTRIGGPMLHDGYACLRIALDAGVATLTIDHPPIQLFDLPLMLEMDRAGRELEADPAVRVVVVQSADPDFFIAHGDVNILARWRGPCDGAELLPELWTASAPCRSAPRSSSCAAAGACPSMVCARRARSRRAGTAEVWWGSARGQRHAAPAPASGRRRPGCARRRGLQTSPSATAW
jgi:hypothetical protein